jgi:cytochrome c553
MKNIFTTSLSLVAIAACIYFSACKTKKAPATACASSPTYTADIKSILDASCMPCHSAEKHKHNIDLSGYETTKESAAGKNFLGSIRHEAGYDAMPAKADKLSDATIEKISCWIQNGMPK